MAFLKTVGICQVFERKDILNNIDLEIDKGEVFTLIGPTGAGKTTLIRILALLDKPYTGRYYFDGTDLTGPQSLQFEARRRTAYVQQRPIVFAMNVFDNVACGLKWRHIQSAVIKRRVDKVLELVGMADYWNRTAKTLSGGEIQRVAIARAIVTEPEVLFLDEPTANMDPVSTAKIEKVLELLISERKTTIIMTTHNMSQGQRLASRLGVIISGKLIQTGGIDDIFIYPQNKEVADFVGVENILKGEVVKKDNGLVSVQLNNQYVYSVSEVETGQRVYVLIRPENIVFSSSQNAGSSRNVFKCRVTRINTIGSLVRIEVDCGFTLLGVVTTDAARELNISLGKEMYASFKATSTHVIKI